MPSQNNANIFIFFSLAPLFYSLVASFIVNFCMQDYVREDSSGPDNQIIIRAPTFMENLTKIEIYYVSQHAVYAGTFAVSFIFINVIDQLIYL